MTTRFPPPLRQGDTIGITAVSSGVDERLIPRLEHIIGQLTQQGYRVDQGQCLRKVLPSIPSDRGASASAIERAAEFNEFLHDPKVTVVAPPWGGELAIQILPYIDFTELTALKPKWIFGFSDVSTILFPLTLCADWATLHCSNLMDLSAGQQDPLTASVFKILSSPTDQEIVQCSSKQWQLKYPDLAACPTAGFNLTEQTHWKVLAAHRAVVGIDPPQLTFHGRLIGGCLDTLRHLAGTGYGDVPSYIARNRERNEGTILYLENCELAPFDLARTLFGLRLAGWFDDLSGLMLGRNSGPNSVGEDDPYTYNDAMLQSLDGLPCPILYDVDIGHRQPQLCLINGAHARVHYSAGAGSVTLRLG